MASVAEIDGLRAPLAPFVGLLDTYANAEAAFSVRRLYSLYTGACMRVRRDSDNVEADIGFDSNDEFGLTSPVSSPSSGGPYTDFADFIGHGGTPANGFVRWWYDQSQAGGTGSGNDAGAAGAVRQPKIYDSSTGIIEEGAVGFEKPALDFDGTDQLIAPFDFATNLYHSFFVTHQLSGVGMLISAEGDGSYIGMIAQSNTAITIAIGWNGAADSDPATNDDWTLYRKDGSAAFTGVATRGDYLADIFDGTQRLVGFLTNSNGLSTSSTSLSIGAYTGPALFVNGTVQELILFQSTTSNESSNASGIETDVNGYFNIY
jgi:hypothetical protein